MPVYANDAQLYECFQNLFGVIQRQEPGAADALLKSSLAISFLCSAPAATITIDARKRPLQLSYGPTSLKPTIEVSLSSDVLHCLLLGEMRLTKAIGSDKMNLKGPVWKAMTLADVFHHAQRFYPQVLRENGLPVVCPEKP